MLCLFRSLLVTIGFASVALTTRVTYRNKHYYYFDVDGNAIDSTNGKVEWVKDQYFWIGEPDSCGTKVCDKISYSSSDLINWHFNGPLFNLTENAAYCIGGFGGCSRPKVIYNEKTQKYVFYGFASKIGGPVGVPVFTSDKLTSGYTYAGEMIPEYAPAGFGVEDLGLSVIDGKGYLSYTGFNLTATIFGPPPGDIWPPFIQTVVIQQLTDDFLNGTGKAYPVVDAGSDFPVLPTSSNLVDGQVESPDLFKRGNTYYMVGSATCSFCAGTLTLAYRSASPFGPWKRQIVDTDNTCGGQAMGVMTVPPVAGSKDNSYVYHADAFHTAPVGQHFTAAKGHGFWPLSFNGDGSIKRIDCRPNTEYTIDAPPATANVPSTGIATAATDGSGNYGDYWSETGLLTQLFLYQTWTSSKSGTLTEVGINLASNSPAANPLTITVFTYKDESELLNPFFKWNVLATKNIGQKVDTSFVAFKVQRVAVNKSIKAGDRVGIALTVPGSGPATNSLPYAYLLQDTSGSSTNHKLYYVTRGHVSRDGRYATQSPIKVVDDREMKWYATVV